MTAETPTGSTRAGGLQLIAGASVVAAVVPIVVATVRAIRSGWLPIGDNALFEIRARDVFTAHHPLVGTWTSASQSIGVHINNPGPLLFDLLALPTKLGGGAGLAAGVAMLNIVCVLGIAYVARRRSGALGVALAMLFTTGLLWTLGSELLFDPWQPHSLLLPFLLLLTFVWSLAEGDLTALPWAVFLSSLIIQTHLSYAILVVLLLGASTTTSIVAVVRQRRRDPPAWAAQRRRVATLAGVSSFVGAVCWAQPLIDQFSASGHRNLGNVLTNSGSGGATIGVSLGTRLVGSILGLPPFWGRPSIEKGLAFLGDRSLPTLGVASLALAAVAVAFLAAFVVAARAGDRPARAAVGVAMLGVTAACITTVILPVGKFAVAPHQLRWLWPIAVFATFALALTLARAAARTSSGGVVATISLVALAGTITFSGLTLPSYNPMTGPAADADAIPTTRQLIKQLRTLEGQGPFVYDIRTLRFAEPYSVPVMAELDRRGVEFRLDEEGMIHQFGRSREAVGEEQGRLFQREGDAAFEAPSGGTLIARVVGLSESDRAKMEQLQAELSAHIAETGLTLNAAGREAVRLGAVRGFGSPESVLRQAEPFIRSYDFVRLAQDDLAVADPAWRARLRRYGALRERWMEHTVAIYLVPAS